MASIFYTRINGLNQNFNIPFKATGLMQKMGINAYELKRGLIYLNKLNKKGVLGKGKQIDTNLNFKELGSFELGV